MSRVLLTSIVREDGKVFTRACQRCCVRSCDGAERRTYGDGAAAVEQGAEGARRAGPERNGVGGALLQEGAGDARQDPAVRNGPGHPCVERAMALIPVLHRVPAVPGARRGVRFRERAILLRETRRHLGPEGLLPGTGLGPGTLLQALGCGQGTRSLGPPLRGLFVAIFDSAMRAEGGPSHL